jgi:hypothetical protein
MARENVRAVESTGSGEAMRERLGWSEICARYPDEWVVLGDIDWTDEDQGEFRSAVVLGHGQQRAVAMAAAGPRLPPGTDFARLYTGEVKGAISLGLLGR